MPLASIMALATPAIYVERVTKLRYRGSEKDP